MVWRKEEILETIRMVSSEHLDTSCNNSPSVTPGKFSGRSANSQTSSRVL